MVNNRTAVAIVGGVTVGTAVAATASVIMWTLIPIGIWSMTVGVIGAQTMNVLRVKTGQLQPVHVVKVDPGKVVNFPSSNVQ